MRKVILAVIILSFIFASGFLSATDVANNIPIQIQTLDSSGNVITGTFIFQINISNSVTCSPVLYSDTTTKTTDSRGVVSYSLENVNLAFDEQYWFCYYRDGVLKETIKASRVPYAFRARNITSSGIVFDSDVNTGSYNFATAGNATANYFYGNGSQLTGITGGSGISWATAINGTLALNSSLADYYLNSNPFGFYNSTNPPPSSGGISGLGTYGYIPMWNSTSSINNSNIFQLGSNVGIGTSTPGYPLHVLKAASDPNSPIDVLVVETTGSSTGGGPSILFKDPPFTASEMARISSLYEYTGNYLGTLAFFTNGGSLTEKMRIIGNGNVGIGTSTPQNALNVIGDINATGLLYGNGSQLTNLPAGTETLWNANYSTFLTHITWANVMNNTLATWTQVMNGSVSSGGSGVPTGAISAFNLSSCPTGWTSIGTVNGTGVVDSGNNSNGYYIKFSDGTMMQRGWGYVYGNGGNYVTKVINYPIAFIDNNYDIVASSIGFKADTGGTTPPTNQRNISGADIQFVASASSNNLTSATIFVSGLQAADGVTNYAMSTNQDYLFSWTATGRWTNAGVSYVTCQKNAEDTPVSNTIWGTSGSNAFVQNTSLNVGIGTTSPSNKLNVVGNTNLTGNLTVGTGTDFLTILSDGASTFLSSAYNFVFNRSATIQGNLTVTGSLNVSGASRVRARNNNSQSIPHATQTIIIWNAEDYDNLGEYNTATGVFTAIEAGYYYVNAYCLLSSTAWGAAGVTELTLYKNNVAFSKGYYDTADAIVTKYATGNINDIIYLAAGDYITIKAYQDKGAAITLYGSGEYNHFAVHRLS
jgi:hypothetical protein